LLYLSDAKMAVKQKISKDRRKSKKKSIDQLKKAIKTISGIRKRRGEKNND